MAYRIEKYNFNKRPRRIGGGAIQQFQQRNAFTLLELLIYTGIVVVVLTMISGILYYIASFSLRSRARQEVLHNGRFAVEMLNRDIAASDSVIIPENNATDSSLSLQKGEEEIITYQVGDNRLERGDYNQLQNITGNQVTVSNLNFTRNDSDNPSHPVIQVTFTLGYSGTVFGSQPVSENFQFSQYIR